MSVSFTSRVILCIAEPAGISDGSGGISQESATTSAGSESSAQPLPVADRSAQVTSPNVLQIPSANQLPPDPETLLACLAPVQLRALESLLAGKNVAATARELRISRNTLHNWLKHNHAFAALFNQGHEHLQHEAHHRLMTTAEKAADNIAEAVEHGNAQISLQLLKGLGILKPRPIGPTDPELMKLQIEIDTRAPKVKALNKLAILDIEEALSTPPK